MFKIWFNDFREKNITTDLFIFGSLFIITWLEKKTNKKTNNLTCHFLLMQVTLIFNKDDNKEGDDCEIYSLQKWLQWSSTMTWSQPSPSYHQPPWWWGGYDNHDQQSSTMVETKSRAHILFLHLSLVGCSIIRNGRIIMKKVYMKCKKYSDPKRYCQ